MWVVAAATLETAPPSLSDEILSVAPDPGVETPG